MNLDHFLYTTTLPAPDRTVPMTGQTTRLGGTAGNIARAAAHEGLRVGLVSGVGPEFPEAFRSTFRREGIDLSGVRTAPRSRSSSCFIVEDGRGGQMTLIDQGVLGDGTGFRFPAAAARRASFVHLTTGPPEALLHLAEQLRGGPKLSADPAQEVHYRWDAGGLSKMLARSEILFGNRSEIDQTVRILGASGPRALLERVPLIVATLGPAGAVAYSRSGTVRVPGRRLRNLGQVTGAGDAFRGGFYGGWCRGWPLRRSLTEGVRSASRWIESAGALPPRRRRGRP